MKINHINIENVLGISNADVALDKKVTYFMGKNGAGKSSIKEAVKLALLGQPERVTLKKEYGSLIHNNGKAGVVSLGLEGASSDEASFVLPKGAHSAPEFKSAMVYCLDPHLFAALKPEEKRAFLFELTGTKVNREAISKQLAEAGVSATVIDSVLPMLRQGFAAAASYAEAQRKECRGAWRGVTGETYGEVKAQTWQAELPSRPDDGGNISIAELEQSLSALRATLAENNQALGAARKDRSIRTAAQTNLDALKKDASRLERVKAKIAVDDSEYDRIKADYDECALRAGTAKREGLIHDLARYLNGFVKHCSTGNDSFDREAAQAVGRYEDQHGDVLAGVARDPEAEKRLPELKAALDLMESAVRNNQRDLTICEHAAETLEKTAGNQLPGVDAIDEKIKTIEALIKTIDADIRTYSEKLEVEKNAAHAAESAEKRTKQAQEYHQQAMAWGVALDLLSPDGIPAQILRDALGPFNAMLSSVAETFDWAPVMLDGDMNLTFGDRPYQLLSESEKWRVDAVIGLTISSISNLRIVVLDRFDVLDIYGKNELIDGLDNLAADDYLDTALVMGTVKAKPDLSDFPETDVFWVEGGSLASKQLLKKVA